MVQRRTVIRSGRAAAAVAVVVALAAAVPAAAPGAAPSVAAAPGGTTSAADRLIDVRLGLRGPATVAPTAALRAGPIAPQATLTLDPLTGTVRSLQRLDGALTAPASAPPATVARSYARAVAPALGLDATDVAHLRLDASRTGPTGLTVVRFRQEVHGVPAFDNGLQVAVDRAGRVLSVAGTPRADLPADLPAPVLDAPAALRAVARASGAPDPAGAIDHAGTDARRTTTFTTGDTARLVLFGARTVHLAWHVTFRADALHWYDAVVDAADGTVLYRANLVRGAVPISVYDNYPGAAEGGTQDAEDAGPWLFSGATTLSGPNVHAFADRNDDDATNPGEEVAPGTYPAATNTLASGGCDAGHRCTWSHLVPSSWMANQSQDVTQTFFYANTFHDHLASDPIDFTAADGSFDGGSDPLQLNALDGATTAGTHPDAAHINNANMATPPDGVSPRMQMYLFSYNPSAAVRFRDVDGGDDAAVLYHEYTHGMSGRLITNAEGTQALNAPQAGALSEGWSDFYALDLLVREGLVDDTPGVDGQVDMGRYVDATPHALRNEAVDCAVTPVDAAACPGGRDTGPGGFTYGDFGRVEGGPEVHGDGEIWAQTLWQLRQALIDRLGSEDAGSDAVERLVTDAMRLSVAEPSFLDMRNALLAADLNDFGGANRTLIWEVFRSRGMGFFAATTGADDTTVSEDFSAPPDPAGPRGTIAGTVTNVDSGLPIAGATAAIGGLDAQAVPGAPDRATTDAAGHYAIVGVPQGTYPKVAISAPGYRTLVQPAGVPGGGVATLDAGLERNWASRSGGGTIRATNDDSGAGAGCGTAALIDQDRGVGWSALNLTGDPNPARRQSPTVTLELPQPVTVERFGMDPGATCGDGPSSTTKGYLLETSPDGSTWTVASQGAFAATDAGRVVTIVPQAGAAGVRFVRLTLASPQSAALGSSGAKYIDFSELEVYGTPVNALPAGTLVAAPRTVAAGQVVTLDASSFADPDSAITGYRWDLDGNGTIDRATTTPITQTTFAAAGRYAPAVAVDDVRGGSGTASTTLTVYPPSLTSGAGKARPVLVVPRTAGKGRIRVKVTCKDACRLSGTVTVTAAVRRRYRLAARTVARLSPRTIKGTKTVTITITKIAGRKLKAHHAKSMRVALRLQATVPQGGPKRSVTRAVKLNL